MKSLEFFDLRTNINCNRFDLKKYSSLVQLFRKMAENDSFKLGGGNHRAEFWLDKKVRKSPLKLLDQVLPISWDAPDCRDPPSKIRMGLQREVPGGVTYKSGGGTGKATHAIMSSNLTQVLQLFPTSSCPRRPNHQVNYFWILYFFNQHFWFISFHNRGCVVKHVSQKWNESNNKYTGYNVLVIFILEFNCTSILDPDKTYQ